MATESRKATARVTVNKDSVQRGQQPAINFEAGAGITITVEEEPTLDQSTVNITAAAHAASHQNGGSDEISVAGLSGTLADDQPFDTKPYMVTDTTGNQAINGPITVNLDNEEIADANYSLAADEITISLAGTYLVSFSLSWDITDFGGADRGRVDGWIEDDDSGAYALAPGSPIGDYHRENTDNGSSVSNTFLLYLANPNKKIRLRAEQTTGNTNVDTRADHTQVSIIKVA